MILKNAVSPGEVLRDELLGPLGVNAGELAEDLGVTQRHLQRIFDGDADVTPQLADALGERFGTSAAFWQNLQLSYNHAKKP